MSVSLSVSVFLSVCQSVSVCLSICLSVSLTFAYGEFRVQVWGLVGADTAKGNNNNNHHHQTRALHSKLPFRCLNPASKLTCLRQLSAGRISAVFRPRLPPITSHLPPPPQPPTVTLCMNVLPECFNCHGRESERECRELERWWVVRE